MTLHHLEPRNLTELAEIVAPILQRTIPGDSVTAQAAAVAGAMCARAFGSVWYAPQFCYVIGGIPRFNALASRAKLMSAPGIVCEMVTRTPDKAHLRVTRDGRSVDFVWTIDRATKAGLLARKGPWHTHPEAMLSARCWGDAGAYHADVLDGVASDDDLPTDTEIEQVQSAATTAPDSLIARRAMQTGIPDTTPTDAPAPAPTPTPSAVDRIRAVVATRAEWRAKIGRDGLSEFGASVKALPADDAEKLAMVVETADADRIDGLLDRALARMRELADANAAFPPDATTTATPAPAEAPEEPAPTPVQSTSSNDTASDKPDAKVAVRVAITRHMKAARESGAVSYDDAALAAWLKGETNDELEMARAILDSGNDIARAELVNNIARGLAKRAK